MAAINPIMTFSSLCCGAISTLTAYADFQSGLPLIAMQLFVGRALCCGDVPELSLVYPPAIKFAITQIMIM